MTPMLQQWLQAKQQAPDALLLFRMGDFYEMFGQDAQQAAPILELAVTSRDKNSNNPIAMAGFPHHSADSYIAKLLQQGLKVAVCDQLEDPAAAKGIVQRGVTRVVTPGTNMQQEALPAKQANYLVGVSYVGGDFGLAALDWSTGQFMVACSDKQQQLFEELQRLAPVEVLLQQECAQLQALKQALQQVNAKRLQRCRVEERAVSQVVHDLLAALGEMPKQLQQQASGRQAALLVLDYVKQTQGALGSHVQSPRCYSIDKQMLMDSTTRLHVGLCRSKQGDGSSKSLIDFVDRTCTAMGARRLNFMLQSPSTDVAVIEQRHNCVAALLTDPGLLQTLQQQLRGVYDLQRLTAKSAGGSANPRQLGQLRDSLGCLPELIGKLTNSGQQVLQHMGSRIDALQQLYNTLQRALVDQPPLLLRDTAVFRSGYDSALDELTQLAHGGRQRIAQIETQERQATGIANLKVKYTRVFGYYIEVTKTHLAKVPQHYTRKQTVAGGERYVTTQLQQLEQQLNTAEVKRVQREAQLFEQLRTQVAQQASDLLRTAQQIAHLDALCSFAQLSAERRYVRPAMLPAQQRCMHIEQGRHALLDLLYAQHSKPLVPTDLQLVGSKRQIVLITGPNMAGKSTTMLQAALIQLLAQAGCFVPAKQARLSICDRLFARVGASDDILQGSSTFMVEMQETAHILHHATPHSLVLLDEIGRGTSTFDGLSIAWAVTEYLHEHVGARVLFATHYHELTQLAQKLPRLHNAHVSVAEQGQQIRFLYCLQPGCAHKSYGIHVARLAQLPQQVINRAQQVLTSLEHKQQSGGKKAGAQLQRSLFVAGATNKPNCVASEATHRANSADDHRQYSDFVAKVLAVDINRTTPIDSLQTLAQLQQLARQLADDPHADATHSQPQQQAATAAAPLHPQPAEVR